MKSPTMVVNGGQVMNSSTIGPQWGESVAGVPGLFVGGNAEIKGTLTVGGQEITKTIDQRLSAIEERLAILRLDSDLESRWEELRLVRERYMELETEIRSYERVLQVLKT